jgi:RNA polymerase subunit RPABC4/transcription elongation factor Spt4
MANDLFGELGGLFGGLAKSVIPKDTPEGKLLAAKSDMSDLEKQEEALLLEIGRAAYESNPSAWPQDAKLQLIRQNMEAAKATLNQAQSEKASAEAQEKAQTAALTCSACGTVNPEGTKFCQECGNKVGVAEKTFCTNCGAELANGTRFCGECGAKQGE